MTVAELIETLIKFDQSAEVVCLNDVGYSYGVDLYLAELGQLKNKYSVRDMEITDDPDEYPVGDEYPNVVVRKFAALIVTSPGSDQTTGRKGWLKL